MEGSHLQSHHCTNRSTSRDIYKFHHRWQVKEVKSDHFNALQSSFYVCHGSGWCVVVGDGEWWMPDGWMGTWWWGQARTHPLGFILDSLYWTLGIVNSWIRKTCRWWLTPPNTMELQNWMMFKFFCFFLFISFFPGFRCKENLLVVVNEPDFETTVSW